MDAVDGTAWIPDDSGRSHAAKSLSMSSANDVMSFLAIRYTLTASTTRLFPSQRAGAVAASRESRAHSHP